MRHVRTRLILFLTFTVLISAFLAGLLSFLTGWILDMNGVRFSFRIGFALREILMPLFTVLITATFAAAMARKAVLPVTELTRATNEIASGNFDVTMTGTDRKDEFGQLSRDFLRMAGELKANEYLAKDFISNVSHEFRTPLSIISGYALLLDSNELSPAERHDYVLKIRSETDRLIKLASNILGLSKLDNQTIPEPPKYFSLDEQLRQAVLELEPGWSAKRIRMNIELPEITYLGNEALMGQVWLNLLDNAIKFTPAGGTISVDAKSNGNVTVTVADTGIGMTQATVDRIFERFFQGDTSHSERGNGLGLALVKRILDVAGGTISVKSVPEQGSVFTVTLPQKDQSALKDT